MPTTFKQLAQLCKAIAITTKKKEKAGIIAKFLTNIDPDEISPSVLLIIGRVFPEFNSQTLDVGYSSIKKVIEQRGQTSLFMHQLSIIQVHKTLLEIATKKGQGSRRLKEHLLEGLMNSMSNLESDIFVRILFGEMRIGVSNGVMLYSIAEATGIHLSSLRRALMMVGDIGKVAKIAITKGEKGLDKIDVSLFMPLKPMLANIAKNTAEAIKEHGGKTAFEYKYDGARIQIHRKADQVKIFSRRLSDVTQSIPDIVQLIQDQIPVGDLILEGEVLAIGENERPLPFQDLMRRFSRVQNVKEMVEKIPLRLYLFDLLFHEGNLLIDEPYLERWARLKKITSKNLRARRIITDSIEEAQAFLIAALEGGHEGLMAKRLDSDYAPGSRGKKWLKIKQAYTLDLVVVAADWGSGRRRGWLSNYHLGIQNGEEYLVVGKTFKGLTDEEFIWMTDYLQKIKISETNYTIYVKPKLVVEVTFNEIQKSPKYKSGLALRFARVTNILEDKFPDDANTFEKVVELYEKKFKYKDKLI